MDGKEELKQIYDIFADCWRLYKRLYPPSRPEDDTYWQGMMKELEVLKITIFCHLLISKKFPLRIIRF